MSHSLTDIIKAVHRAKGDTLLLEFKKGEAVAIWRREEIGEHIVLERNPDGSSPIVFK